MITEADTSHKRILPKLIAMDWDTPPDSFTKQNTCVEGRALLASNGAYRVPPERADYRW